MASLDRFGLVGSLFAVEDNCLTDCQTCLAFRLVLILYVETIKNDRNEDLQLEGKYFDWQSIGKHPEK